MPRKKNAESRAYYYLIGSEVASKLSNGQTLTKSDLTKLYKAIDEKADSTSLPKKINRFFDILSPVFKREDVGNRNFKVVFVDPTISTNQAGQPQSATQQPPMPAPPVNPNIEKAEVNKTFVG